MKKSIILVVTLILNINCLCFASCFLGNTDARACMMQEQQMQMQRRQMEMQSQQMNMQQRNYYGY